MDEKKRKVRSGTDVNTGKHGWSCRPTTDACEDQKDRKEQTPELVPQELETPNPAMYACRWPDGTISLVWAQNRLDAVLQLDEFGPAEPEFVFPLSTCVLDFALADDGTLQLVTMGEETSEEVFQRCYPRLVEAKEAFPPDEGKIKDAVAFEHARLEGSGVTPAKSAQGRI